MNSIWTRLGSDVRIVYLLRVPILTLVILMAFGILAIGPVRSMLGGLFDLDGYFFSLVSVASTALLVSAAAVTAINLTLRYGGERLQDPNVHLDCNRHPLLIFFASLIPAATLIVCACSQTHLSNRPGLNIALEALASLMGLAIAGFLIIAAKYLQLKFTDPRVTPHPPPYLVFPVQLYSNSWLSRKFDEVYRQRPKRKFLSLKRFFRRRVIWLFDLFEPAGPGYFVPNRRPLKLYSGHIFALSLSLLSAGFYVGIGLAKKAGIGQGAHVPSLTYVLLFLLLACWSFSALSFFLDRYRWPVLATFVLLCFITKAAPESDHFYRVEPRREAVVKLKPAEILAKKALTPILVATAGGGIQAAAWTTEVLAGVAEACHCDFAKRVVLVSAVSGGSVGALFFGNNIGDLPKARSNARLSSLDDVAWGWINPDVWRAILPWFGNHLIDRGWALERSWEVREQMEQVMLSGWSRRAGNDLPAFLFNATRVESGTPLVFTTADFPLQDPSRPGLGITDFDRLYGDRYDVRVSTAARLSASFPYVAPASRSSGPCLYCPDFHVVDGGYYDNYGLLTLIQWLEEALQASPVKPSKVHILQIRSFPPDKPAPGRQRGWGYQTWVPLDAFLHTRSSAQLAEAHRQLQLFRSYWLEREGAKVDIETSELEYPALPGCEEPPLSWKLTQPQKDCIDAGWKAGSVQDEVKKVVAYLATPQPTEERKEPLR